VKNRKLYEKSVILNNACPACKERCLQAGCVLLKNTEKISWHIDSQIFLEHESKSSLDKNIKHVSAPVIYRNMPCWRLLHWGRNRKSRKTRAYLRY